MRILNLEGLTSKQWSINMMVQSNPTFAIETLFFFLQKMYLGQKVKAEMMYIVRKHHYGNLY